MIEVFAGAKRGVEIALRAENLFGTEASVLVGAAGTGERARVDDHDLALRAKHCLRREISRHRCRGLAFRLGYGKLAPFAVLVDLGRLDGRLRFACERPAHQRKVLRCGFAPLVTCGHAASFPGNNANKAYGSSFAGWGMGRAGDATRFAQIVGALGLPSTRRGLFGNAQSLKQSSLRCGTRFVGAAEEPLSGRGSQSLSATSSRSDSPRFA